MTSAFAEDRGEADPVLLAALKAWQDGGNPARAVTVLREARLLVGLVPLPPGSTQQHNHDDGEHDHHDHDHGEHDHHNHGDHMGAGMLHRPDGRVAMLAFSSVEAVAAWDATARPLPVLGPELARAAIDEGADTLLIDGTWGITGVMLWALAEDRMLLPPMGDPAVLAVIYTAVPEMLNAAQLPSWVHVDPGGDNADLTVVVTEELMEHPEVATAIAERLSGDLTLRSRLGKGLMLAVSPPRDQ